MGRKQLFVKPMLVELNKTTGGQMEKKEILKLALEYGDVKYRLGNEWNEEERERLHKRRMELLDKLYEACLND